MLKPCRLELKNKGGWKLLDKFDAADEEHADEILLHAGALVDVLNAPCGLPGPTTLRITTDEALPGVLMLYETGKGWLRPDGGTT